MLYNEGLAYGNARFQANTLKVALLKTTYTPDKTHKGFSAVSGEELGTSGTGYTAGGATLGGKGLTVDDTNHKAYDTAADVEYGQLNNGTIRYAAIYDSVADLLIRVIDFGSDKVLNDSEVTLRFTNTRVREHSAA